MGKRNFIRRWSEYLKEYNRKLKNQRRVEEIRFAHEKKRYVSKGNKSTSSSYKKGITISKPYSKW